MISTQPELTLFSASPRRRELLERWGLPFRVVPVDADESVPRGVPPYEVVQAIALRKLHAGMKTSGFSPETDWGLAADTLVEGPGGLLGKPAGRDEALEMLTALSGREHRVHSGFAVYAPAPPDAMTVRTGFHSTTVVFRALSTGEIHRYVATGEWEGAAGAYRIQQKGELLVEEIRGLWSTIVGLPLAPLYGILSELSYPGI